MSTTVTIIKGSPKRRWRWASFGFVWGHWRYALNHRGDLVARWWAWEWEE
jgi:hypothetical protein